MSSSPKALYSELSHPGPHPVGRGDLALVGVPGMVYAPRTGTRVPAIAFGHGLMQPPERYAGLLRHLASWGIAAACPGTQRGPLPSHRLYAADLRTTLDVLSTVQLGDGDLSVDTSRLGLAGHSAGASAAVLLAASDPRVVAVATLAMAESRPSAIDAARDCRMPSLHLVGAEDVIAPPVGHAKAIASVWAGPMQLRTVAKASHLGFTEGRHWSELLLDGKGEPKSMHAAKVILTAFFLRHLAGDTRFEALLKADVKRASIVDDRPEVLTTRS